MDRKRRIEQLVGHLESKLEVKRRKLSRLHEELRQLENFQIDPSLVPILSPLPVDQSTPISKRSSSIFAKNAHQLQDQSTLSGKWSFINDVTPILKVPHLSHLLLSLMSLWN